MLLLLMGCQSVKADGISVHLHIDGTDRVVHSTAPTVRILCQQLDVQLTALDHITPPLWTPLEPGMTITVTRTRQERREVILTSTVKTVRDEFLTPEESRGRGSQRWPLGRALSGNL